MNRVELFILLLLTTAIGKAQPVFTITGEISNFDRPAMVYLLSAEGSTWNVYDSTYSKDGKIRYHSDSIPPTGLYCLFWEDNHFLELVIHRENRIDFTADLLLPEYGVQIKISEENKAYYHFKAIQSEIDSLSALGDRYYRDNLTSSLEKIKKQIEQKVDRIEQVADSIDLAHPGLFSVKICKNSLPPDIEKYGKEHPDWSYDSEYYFMSAHYFMNIDKYDSCLVRTRVIYDACSFYLQNFVAEATTENYIRACDFMMSSFSWNDAQYEYVLNLLLNTFDASGHEEVYLHLYDVYYVSSSCSGDFPGEYERKAQSLRLLKAGSTAPELTGSDRNGTTISLSGYRGKSVVVLFWESQCQHCKEILPAVVDFMKARPEIVFITFSLDTNENKWLGGMMEQGLPDPSISDLKGFNGPNALRWYIWGTPSFFVIDSEGKIKAKPLTLKSLEKALR